MNRDRFCLLNRWIVGISVATTLSIQARAGSLALDSSGNLFFEGRNSGEILKFGRDGTKTTFARGSADNPINGEIAVDLAGNVYACANATTILKYTPDGTESVFAAEIGKYWPDAMAFDAAGNLFVSASNTLFKITPDGSKSIFATGADAYGLAFDQSGNLFASDSHGENGHLVSAIIKFTPDGKKSLFSDIHGYGLAFDKSGNLFVAGVDEIVKFGPDGKKSAFAKVDASGGLAFDPSENLIGCDGNNTLFRVSDEGKRSTFQWRAAPGAEEEQGEDSANGLPAKYAKNYLLAQSTLSPDKKFGVIYPATDDSEFPEGKNYLVALKPFAILTKLDTRRPYFKNESHGGMSADWSDDASVALITLDAKWGPGDLFLIELRNGKLLRTTNLLAKLHDLLLPEFKKSKAARYNDYYDFIFETEDDPLYQLKDSKRVEIHASATTDPNQASDRKVWDGLVDAVWDIPQAKFTSQKVSTEFTGIRKHSE